jgi:hypothetical protein
MVLIVTKLNKYLGQPLHEKFVLFMIMKSLPKEYDTFHIHYNTSVQDKWNLDQLMVQCVREEERLKSQKGDSVDFSKHTIPKLNKISKNFKKIGKTYWQGFNQQQPSKVVWKLPYPPDTYLYCKKTGHYKRKCPDFLQYMLENGKDQVTFVDESVRIEYPSYSWWIDLGKTVHVANSLHGFYSNRGLPKGQRIIKVANKKEADVKSHWRSSSTLR